jgi:hypothetical protein
LESPHAAAKKIKGTAASTARARRMDFPRKRRQIRVTLPDNQVGPG